MTSSRIAIPLLEQPCAGSGTRTIERALARIPGVVDAYANPVTDTVYVEYQATRCTLDDLVRAIEGEGFRTGVPRSS